MRTIALTQLLVILFIGGSATGSSAQQSQTTTPPRQETDLASGLVPEPHAIGRAVDFASQWSGGDDSPMDTASRLSWDRLFRGTRTHDFPITVEAARQLGLPVSTAMPPLIYDLMDLYPQSGEGRPSVMYVPLHRTAPSNASRDLPAPAK